MRAVVLRNLGLLRSEVRSDSEHFAQDPCVPNDERQLEQGSKTKYSWKTCIFDCSSGFAVQRVNIEDSEQYLLAHATLFAVARLIRTVTLKVICTKLIEEIILTLNTY